MLEEARVSGIVGYLGEKDGVKLTVEGLKVLSDRGRDDWGLAIKAGPKMKIKKRPGDINLANPEEFSGLSGTIVLGQTRFAVHTVPAGPNAHPHFDCQKRLFVALDGVVSRHDELIDELTKAGCELKTGSDAEVVAHIIERKLAELGNLPEAIRQVVQNLEGEYAFAVVDRTSEALIGVSSGLSLTIGIGENAYCIASDNRAYRSDFAREVRLESGQMAVVGTGQDFPKGCQIFDIKTGRIIAPYIQDIVITSLEPVQATTDKMLSDISSIPTVLERISRLPQEELRKVANIIKRSKNCIFIGSGSSQTAAQYGAILVGKHPSINGINYSGGEALTMIDKYKKDDAIVLLSHSGETAELIKIAHIVKGRGLKVVAIVSRAGSTLSSISDLTVLTLAENEQSYHATVSTIAQMAMIGLLVAVINNETGTAIDGIVAAQNNISALISPKNQNEVDAVAGQIVESALAPIVGNGLSAIAAQETARLLRNVAQVISFGVNGSDYKHDIMSIVEYGTPVVFFSGNDAFDQLNDQQIAEARARGAEVVAISVKENLAAKYNAIVAGQGTFTVLSMIVYGQLLAYYCAKKKELDPDRSLSLIKIYSVI